MVKIIIVLTIIEYVKKNFLKKVMSLLYRIVLIFLLFIANIYAFDCNGSQKGYFEVGGVRGSLDGEMMVGNEDSTTLDLDRDEGLTKSTNNLKAILESGYKDHIFGFKTVRFKFSGKRKLSKDIIFNSDIFAKSTMIRSKLDLRWAQLKYRYRFSKSLNAGIDLNGVELKSAINESRVKDSFLMPSLAIDYNIDLADDLMLVTRTSISPYGDYRYTQGYAGIAFKTKLTNCSMIHLGYQLNQFDINNKAIKASLRYKGFYAGFRVGF